MKVNGYRCDMCQRSKPGTGNHWFLFSSFTDDQTRSGFQIQQWDDDRATRDWVSHLCGEQCVIKKVSQFITEKMEPVGS